MNRIRVLHLRDSPGIYGAERAILTLAEHVRRDRVEFILLCFQYEGESGSSLFMEEARRAGIRVETVQVRGRLDFRAIRDIRDFLKNQSIVILHAHDFKTTFYAWLASWNLGVKRVVTAHGSTRDSLMMKVYLFLDERVVYRFFDRIIAVGQSVAENLLGKGIRSTRVSVIPNGVDPPSSKSVHLDERIGDYFTSADARVFGVIGRLFPDKGHRFFLDAFQRVVQECPGARALIVGNGPLQGELARRIGELGLGGKVVLCGARLDIQDIYRQIDFVVIPSLTEGLPYVLLEALAHGIPVLATAVGDIPQVIRHGETGFLVPAGDTRALHTHMTRLLTDVDAVARMAGNGRRLVTEHYSAGRMAEQTQRLYESLIEASR